MKSVRSTALVGCLAALTLGSPAFGSGGNENAAIALHIADVTTKNPCTVALSNSSIKTYDSRISTADGPFFFTYLLVCNASDSLGIAGMEMGIDYPGAYAPNGGAFPISVFSWNLCGDLDWQYGGWPGPGSSNMVTWDRINHCQRTTYDGLADHVIAIGGYFYMAAYGTATMTVIPRPVSGRAKVAACDPPAETDLTDLYHRLGSASWGDSRPGTGFNPCALYVPVERTTWSNVKSLHRD